MCLPLNSTVTGSGMPIVFTSTGQREWFPSPVRTRTSWRDEFPTPLRTNVGRQEGFPNQVGTSSLRKPHPYVHQPRARGKIPHPCEHQHKGDRWILHPCALRRDSNCSCLSCMDAMLRNTSNSPYTSIAACIPQGGEATNMCRPENASTKGSLVAMEATGTPLIIGA